MEAANKLLWKHVGNSVGGLQLTEKVPIFISRKNMWTSKFPFEMNSSPSYQIHPNHKNHWVATFFLENQIYILHSLGNDRENAGIIPDDLKIQLSQIYGKEQPSVCINVPNVVKQEKSIDCGWYAIAFITAYCLQKRKSFNL